MSQETRELVAWLCMWGLFAILVIILLAFWSP